MQFKLASDVGEPNDSVSAVGIQHLSNLLTYSKPTLRRCICVHTARVASVAVDESSSRQQKEVRRSFHVTLQAATHKATSRQRSIPDRSSSRGRRSNHATAEALLGTVHPRKE